MREWVASSNISICEDAPRNELIIQLMAEVCVLFLAVDQDLGKMEGRVFIGICTTSNTN